MAPRTPQDYRGVHDPLCERITALAVELHPMRADELTDADAMKLDGRSLSQRQATQRAAGYSHAIQLLSDAKSALRRVEYVAENDPRCIDA